MNHKRELLRSLWVEKMGCGLMVPGCRAQEKIPCCLGTLLAVCNTETIQEV